MLTSPPETESRPQYGRDFQVF